MMDITKRHDRVLFGVPVSGPPISLLNTEQGGDTALQACENENRIDYHHYRHR